MTIEEIEKNGLAYKYVRGSTLYGTTIEGSDIDYGGVYISPEESIIGMRSLYEPQISDEKHDITYYELGRWVELLCNGNPNALESLFAPKDKIIGEIHPSVQNIIDNRDCFISKKCFNSLNGYAYEQIRRARGLNKKIVKPVNERKDILDFCYTFSGEGSMPFKKWLDNRGLKQQYCGLVNVPNMRDVYAVYYDFGNHILNEKITKKEFSNSSYCNDKHHMFSIFATEFPMEFLTPNYAYDYHNKPIGYRGVMNTEGKSNEVRLSSIPKSEAKRPICYLSYNKDGYTCHCKDYKEYKEWEEHRNPVRYESNLSKNYDSKNMSHCIRLLHMGKELAEGKGINVVRTWDRQFLIDIRNHKYEYDYLISYAEKLKEEMVELTGKCGLPDDVDIEKINRILIESRKIAYK